MSWIRGFLKSWGDKDSLDYYYGGSAEASIEFTKSDLKTVCLSGVMVLEWEIFKACSTKAFWLFYKVEKEGSACSSARWAEEG